MKVNFNIINARPVHHARFVIYHIPAGLQATHYIYFLSKVIAYPIHSTGYFGFIPHIDASN